MPIHLRSLLWPVVRGLAWPLGWLGLDLRRAAPQRFLPRYWSVRIAFVRAGGRITRSQAVLGDFAASSGTASGHYFHQDLLVARLIHAAAPRRHVDVGSRVDGFVAHVASFREIEVFDIRPQPAPAHPQIRFVQADLMQLDGGLEGCCDSVSCLHALEHFGLGRYGDPIDPKGFERGLENMAALLRRDGIFYLSVPIGLERVEFNGQRVIDPRAMIELAMANSLELRELKVIRQGGSVETLALDQLRLSDLASQRYALGIFTFTKRAEL